MDNSAQETFIGRIRSALGYAPDERRSFENLCNSQFIDETGAILKRIKNRSTAERQQLLDRLIEMAQPINLNVIVQDDEVSTSSAIADLIDSKQPEWGDQKSVVAWKHPLIDALNLEDALAAQKVPVYITDPRDFQAGDNSAKKGHRGLYRNYVG